MMETASSVRGPDPGPAFGSASGRSAGSAPMLLAVSGGYRAGGNTDVLLSRFVQGAESGGARVRTVFLRDLAYTSCVGCELCADTHRCMRFDDDLAPLYEAVQEADGLVLVSPTYNYNVTALMKAFIDRLYPFYDFDGHHPRGYTSALAPSAGSSAERGPRGPAAPRRAAVLAVCEQVRAEDLGFTLDAMAWPLQALGFAVEERIPAYGFFEKGAIRRDPELLDDAERRGHGFAQRL